MTEGFIGDWKQVSCENIEGLLQVLGVNFFLRKAATFANPSSKIEYNKEVNKWTITIIIPIRTIKTTFEVDKEFDEKLPDGKDVKSIVHVENNKFIQTQKDLQGNVWCVITRELINENEHWVIFEAGNVKAKRVFHRIK